MKQNGKGNVVYILTALQGDRTLYVHHIFLSYFYSLQFKNKSYLRNIHDGC